MFKKIVSNLPFSPALVGQLGLYSKKIRQENTTRRIGLIFVILALIVQSLVVFQPPESANAANPNDINNGDQTQLTDNIVRSITSTSASQGFIDASSAIAYPGDQISYTINLKNDSSSLTLTKISDNLSDILEYSTLIDNGGGTLDKTTKILSWPDVTLQSKTEQTRTFAIRLLDTIPATAQGTYNTKSYDCTMTNVFGNSIDIGVDCPVVKTIESVTSDLPKTGILENLVVAGFILTTAIYFYARSRQLEKEIHLIRKDASTGTI